MAAAMSCALDPKPWEIACGHPDRVQEYVLDYDNRRIANQCGACHKILATYVPGPAPRRKPKPIVSYELPGFEKK